MRVAVTGVSGFIGSVLARHLVAAGHSVTGMVRATSRRDHIEGCIDRFVVGEQSDESVWPDLLEGADCVVHNSVDWEVLKARDLAGHLRTNLEGSIRLLHASGSRQFVFVSTVAVHHDMRERWGGKIDEDHPLRPSTLYGAYKAAVEAHLWASHFGEGQHTCALRPCGVYGLDPRLERSHGYKLVERVREGERVGGVRKKGGGKFVHVEDVAAAICATVGNAEAAGRVYDLIDCYARWGDWAVMAREILGVDVEVDLSSPGEPKNMFSKEGARSLGVNLDRGHEGIRSYLKELIGAMDADG